MRVRFLSATYDFGGAATSASLERHYRELRETMLGAGPHYGYLQHVISWRPPTDIHETPDAILVKLEVAGVREDQLEISLYPNALVILGQRDDDGDHDEAVCYHEAQVRYGPFRADIALPTLVRIEDVVATYRDGFLRVTLPKVTAGDPVNNSTPKQHEKGAGAHGAKSGPLNDAAPVSIGLTGSM